jgi:probable rRNA maturation factor
MRELQLRNRQRAQTVNTKFLREVTRALIEEELKLHSYELGIRLVSPAKMAETNWEFLQHEGSTDVITFDYREGYGEGAAELELAGEIFISVADARKQAKEFSTAWQQELVRYVTHGVLHLRGFDDLEPAKRKIMKREENRLMRRLSARFDLRKVGP